jgi:hypothetical protein
VGACTNTGCVAGAPPVAIAEVPSSGPPVANFDVLRLDATDVYWVEYMVGIHRAPKAGGEATLMLGTSMIDQIVVDEDFIYATTLPYSDAGGGELGWVVQFWKDMDAMLTLGIAPNIHALAFDDTHVYWGSGASVHRVPKIDSWMAGEVVADDSTPEPLITELVVDATNVWWLHLDEVDPPITTLLTVDKSGGIGLVTDDHARDHYLVSDGVFAYWISEPGAAAAAIHRASTSSAPAVIQSGGPLADLAVDDTSVYWATNGSIMKAPKAGGSPTVVVSGMSAEPPSIAVDDQCVYWIDVVQGRLMKSHKGSP